MPPKKISTVLGEVGGPIATLTEPTYVPALVTSGGSPVPEDHIVDLRSLFDLLNAQFTAKVNSIISSGQVTLDVGSAPDYLTPGAMSSTFAPPLVWQALYAESVLAVASNQIAFDPLLATPNPSLNMRATISANTSISSFARANMVVGLDYRLEVTATAAATLTFSGLQAGDLTIGVGGGIAIASGRSVELTIRRRQDNSVRIRASQVSDVQLLGFSYSGAHTTEYRTVSGVNYGFLVATGDGILTKTAGSPGQSFSALLLGAGGAGGRGVSGGGAAGQIRGLSGDLVTVSADTGPWAVVVGAGAPRQSTNAADGASGGNTVAFGVTAVGGAGGSRDTTGGNTPGGGGGGSSTTGTNPPGGAAASPGGYVGGAGFGHSTSSNRAGGGGSGMGGAGGAAASGVGGAGGVGLDLVTWLGVNYTVGGGGGGMQTNGAPSAVSHGGGSGGVTTGSIAAVDASRPGAGGGGSNLSYGSAGYRGEVLIRWALG